MDDDIRYANDLATFDALRAVIPKFAAKKAFLRATEPITPAIQKEMGATAPPIGSNRDNAVCALVNKACNTHAPSGCSRTPDTATTRWRWAASCSRTPSS